MIAITGDGTYLVGVRADMAHLWRGTGLNCYEHPRLSVNDQPPHSKGELVLAMAYRIVSPGFMSAGIFELFASWIVLSVGLSLLQPPHLFLGSSSFLVESSHFSA